MTHRVAATTYGEDVGCATSSPELHTIGLISKHRSRRFSRQPPNARATSRPRRLSIMLTRKPSLDAEHFTRLALAAIASTVLAVTIAGPALAGGLPASSPAPSASSVPTPAPVPSATPVPTFQIGGAMTGGTFNSTGLNAVGALDTKSGVDLGSRN